MTNEKLAYRISLPSWLIAIALAVLAFAFAYVLIAQPKRFEFAGLGFGVTPEFDLSARGAVIAFDRKDSEEHGECPEGWSVFKPAVGRMVIGADTVTKKGDPENARLLLPSYAEDNNGAVGGGVRHALTIDEMPVHSHRIEHKGADLSVKYPGDGSSVGVTGTIGSAETGVVGGAQSHNNMPPYIALYFCKKDG